jgi:hypothetical protein
MMGGNGRGAGMGMMTFALLIDALRYRRRDTKSPASS